MQVFALHHWQRWLKSDRSEAASRTAGESVPWFDLGLPHHELGHSERWLLLHEPAAPEGHRPSHPERKEGESDTATPLVSTSLP